MLNIQPTYTYGSNQLNTGNKPCQANNISGTSPVQVLSFSGNEPDPPYLKEAVEKFCRESITAENIKDALKAEMSEARYNHCRRVAIKIAKIVDPELDIKNLDEKEPKDIVLKAVLAGMLHDYAKDWDEEDLLDYSKKHELISTPDEEEFPDKLHAPVSAHKAKNEFGIKDEDILGAIKNHCLGSARPNSQPLTELQKALLITDNMDNAKGNVKNEDPQKRKIRKKTEKTYKDNRDLNETLITMFGLKIKRSIENNDLIKPTIVENYNTLIRLNRSRQTKHNDS